MVTFSLASFPDFNTSTIRGVGVGVFKWNVQFEKWTNPNYDDLAWTWTLSLTTSREAEWSEVKYCPGSRRSAQTPSAGPMICSLPASLARPHLSQCHCGYTELCSLHWGQVQGPRLGTGTAESRASEWLWVWQGALWAGAEERWLWGCHEPPGLVPGDLLASWQPPDMSPATTITH